MSMWTRVQPAYAANMWNEALNKRLGTEVILLSLPPAAILRRPDFKFSSYPRISSNSISLLLSILDVSSYVSLIHSFRVWICTRF